MKNYEIKLKCQNCGAPASQELCPYCGAQTGLNPKLINLEYPRAELERVVVYPKSHAVIILTFVLALITTSIFMMLNVFNEDSIISIITFLIPGLFIAGIGLLTFALFIKQFSKQFTIIVLGKTIEGTVIGYIAEENLDYIIVKILLNINNEKKILLEKDYINIKKYRINSKLKVKIYKNKYYIVDK